MYYLLYLLLLVPCLIFSAWASAKVNRTYAKYNMVSNRSHMTGYDTAVTLLNNRGVCGISVNRISGRLTDHYHPKKAEVNLSESTYGHASVGAVAVAAHEIGHVMQKEQGYLPYKVRNVLVPITNIGSRLALPVMLVGFFLDLFYFSAQPEALPYGQWLVYIGIGLYGLSTLFMLATLPVEFNASRRARKMLLEDNILQEDEIKGAKKVLSAAALTYVASLLVSLVYFLRLILMLFTLFGRKRK